MSELKAEDFYNEIKEYVDKPQFTKLTSTGISSDYKSVFEFAEAYYEERMKARVAKTSNKEALHIHNVSSSQIQKYAEFCIECDRRNINPLTYEDYLNIG